MARGALKKCPYCGERIERDAPSIEYKGRTYHRKCFDIAVNITKQMNSEKKKEKEAKKKKEKQKIPKPERREPKKALSEQEYQEKKAYYNYIRTILNEDNLPVKMYALTEDYIRKYEFTYKKMHNTLIYLNEILQKVLTDNVIGLIPYYYSETERYFNSIKNIEKEMESIDTSQLYQSRTVTINPKRRKRKCKRIDISSIKEGE